MATMKISERQRHAIRSEFSRWRKSNRLSYQDITDKVNEIAGVQLCKYPTVASWGVRGHVPRSALAASLKAAYPDCPLLRHVRDTR